MKETAWRQRPAALAGVGNDTGLVTTPRDTMLFGLMVLNGGVANHGKRIVSEANLNAIFTASATNPAYGRPARRHRQNRQDPSACCVRRRMIFRLQVRPAHTRCAQPGIHGCGPAVEHPVTGDSDPHLACGRKQKQPGRVAGGIEGAAMGAPKNRQLPARNRLPGAAAGEFQPVLAFLHI